MSDSIQYWAFRIDKRRIEYIGGEARQGRLRQGWGWLDGQDLNLPPDKFVDQGAGRNRRPMRKVKKDDVILVPRLPSGSQIAIFTATEDWCSGYRYAEKEGNEGDSYRHVFPVKFEGQFGRHDSHVSGDIRRTFKNLSRFWNITGYAEDIEVIRGTELTEVQKNQGYNDRLQDAIQNSFDRKEFEKDVCAEINKQFEGTAWEFILVDVLQQLNPHFSVERVGGITEGPHGTDILMVSKPATGLGLFDDSEYDSPYGIAIQVKDYSGGVGKEVIDQINKADHWKEERGLMYVDKVVIITNATEEKNKSLAESEGVTVIFRTELNKILAKYAEQQIGVVDD